MQGLSHQDRLNDQVGLMVGREPAANPDTTRMVEAFNIGPYLEFTRRQASVEKGKTQYETSEAAQNRVQRSIDQVKQIITETIAVVHQAQPGEADTPAFQFHPGAALLVVIGTRDAVEVARKVVNALPDQVGQAPSASALPAAMPNGDAAFRARYGLPPQRTGTAPSPTPSAEQEQFSRRYGLEPGTAPATGTPANKTPADPSQAPR